MSLSRVRKHKKNLRAATKRTEDAFEEHPSGGGAQTTIDQPQQQPHLFTHSTAVLDAHSDEDSELARFLFVEKSQGVRNNVPPVAGDDDGNSDVKVASLGTLTSTWYSLFLEPIEVRSERIIMVAEAYAIFGALFLNGTWVLYEWGSHKGYGGEGTNEMVDYLFEAVMAAAICCNIFLALFGSILWIFSIINSGSNQDLVFQARKMLTYCDILLWSTVQLVTIGLFLGIYSNLSPNWPGTIVVLSVGIIVHFAGNKYLLDLIFLACPLEIYHCPLWARVIWHPHAVFTRNGRETLIRRAKHRAEELKTRAYRERKKVVPNVENSSTARSNDSSLGNLLRNAAINLGRTDCDVSIYETRLEEDWYTEVNQIKDEDIDTLSCYMPRMLAKEIHKIIESGEIQTTSIASGNF